MSWTAEQTETLKALHAEGLSCSLIATRLGNGVTRNAVIGKIARLNLNVNSRPSVAAITKRADIYTPDEIAAVRDASLSDREAAVRIGRSVKSVVNKRHDVGIIKQKRVANPYGWTSKTRHASRAHDSYGTPSNAAVRLDTEIEAPPEPRGDKPTLMQLRHGECKFPFGDPRHAEFAFCGQRVWREGVSYCAGHAAICYQPLARR